MNPPTKEDVVAIVCCDLPDQKIGWHTYQTEEEKTLRVTMKKIVKNIPAR